MYDKFFSVEFIFFLWKGCFLVNVVNKFIFEGINGYIEFLNIW